MEPARELAWSTNGEPEAVRAVPVEMVPSPRLHPVGHGPGGLLTASRPQLAAKRLLDVVGALALLLLLAVLMLVIAMTVALTSRGPVLYVQERVGKGGRAFRMPKFRSMRRDADELLAELATLNEMSGPVFKIRDDPRVTRVGRVLRRLSLDELPQLWCVLAGEMSLVGPRPPLPAECRQYTPREWRRMDVQPGLTCIWQVSGRSDVDFDRWIDLDLQYIHEWTPLLDLRLLIQTIPAILRGSGAY